jgi:heat shock protein HslJ
MRRSAAAALALLMTVSLVSGCAEYTTTGAPADEAGEEGLGQSLAPSVDQLAGTTWSLKSSSAEAIDLGQFGITADFADAVMSGKAPINQYNASYTLDGEQFTLGPIATTRMAGPDKDMAAEAAYLAQLGKVTAFHLEGNELQLLVGEEPVLEYEARDVPGDEMADTQKFADTVVGMTTAAAEQAAKDAGYGFRVVEEDGVPKAATSDLRADRVNVVVEDGKVTSATAG